MDEYSPIEYLKIDIANNFGLDKEVWQDRIDWVNQNKSVLEVYDEHADSPILYRKAVRAYRKHQSGHPVSHIMGLDATASGPQLMACMSGCVSSMDVVNVTNTGRRRDIYTEGAKTMSKIAQKTFIRADVKQPIMTYFYGSQAVPKQVFGDQAPAFFNTMATLMPGPAQLMQLFQSCWDPEATYYSWTMPDGHRVHIPVTDVETKGMEIDEADHFRYTYRTQVVKPKEEGRALAANIVHSVDAWVCRQMVRRTSNMGFQMAPIHDCFFASPKHMQKVRETYRDLLIEVHERNFVSDILSQIKGETFHYEKLEDNLSAHIASSEYALS